MSSRQKVWRHRCIGGVLLLAGTLSIAADAPNPRERIDFWRKNYTALTSDTNSQAARAQEIFQRIVRAAGRRPGVEPRLHVIAENPANASLPMAIPDGWIVISQRVLDLCYRDSVRGDDRLAFVLAHEIAHQLEDDFWHMKFFQAIQSAQGGKRDARVMAELRDIAALTDKVLAKELRADELGITYSAMAGFDPGVILNDSGPGSFFHQWIAALNPERLNTAVSSATHPAPSQRAAAVRARLQQVTEQSELFRLGLMFYQAGDFRRAALAFDEFRRYFPGREVQHNLGAAYHQLALRQWRPPANRHEPLFKLSVAVDPLSRAYGGTHRSPSDASQSFEQNIAKAIAHYELALAQDPAYLPAHRNIASAYILKGEPYKAIAVLQDALKIAPGDPVVLNNLGVAFFYTKNLDDAHDYLNRAQKADVAYDAPLFNLASLADHQGRTEQAGLLWQRYLNRDSASDWAMLVRQRQTNTNARDARALPASAEPEALLGLEIGAYAKEVPRAWGAPATKTFALEFPAHVARYDNGVLTVAHGEEIRLIAAMGTFKGTSRRDIRIGSSRDDLERRYGAPARILNTTTGESFMYPAHGVTFNLEKGRVASWLLYWD